MIIAIYFAVALIGYLLGSIPFGLLIGKRSANVDIRQIGSGKTGTTNVLRAAGKKAAALALVLDLLKGALAVALAKLIVGGGYLATGDPGSWPPSSAPVLAGLAAIAGHIWPIFVKFKGGRGVAPFFGGALALYPPIALAGGGILIIVAAATRYMSLGSISGATGIFIILIPLTIMGKTPIPHLAYSLIGAIFIIVMHRDNIDRLRSGTERKLGEKIQIKNPPKNKASRSRL